MDCWYCEDCKEKYLGSAFETPAEPCSKCGGRKVYRDAKQPLLNMKAVIRVESFEFDWATGRGLFVVHVNGRPVGLVMFRPGVNQLPFLQMVYLGEGCVRGAA